MVLHNPDKGFPFRDDVYVESKRSGKGEMGGSAEREEL